MSLSEKHDDVQQSMTEFFQRQKTNEEKTDRSHSEKKLTEVINQAQADANMSNFFTANRDRVAAQERESHHSHQKLSYSPQKKGRADPKSLFSRKGVTEREKEQIFLEYYDENLKLRSNQTKLEQHIKELKTKVRVIEGEYTYSKKKFEGDRMVKEDLNFIEDLKRENESLKAQLKETQLPRPQLPTSNKKVLVKSTAPKSGISSKTNSDHIRLIDLLKAQLKKAEGEIQSLHHQMAHKGGASSALGHSDMHDRNVKIATLQHRFENLDGAFASQKNMLDKNKQMIEDLNRQLYQERTRNNQLEVQLRSAELAAATAKDLQLQLDETEREKKMLEAKYKDLVESPFFKDINEKAANPARLREAENQLSELKAQMKSVHDTNNSNEKQIVELKAQLKTAMLEKEKFKDEKTKAEAILQEKERTQGFLDKQMEIFNISSDRERDNFLKALGTVRLQGEEPAWKRLEFIERHGELDINNVPSLLKEIDRLRIEKSEIAAQLEKAQTLLHTHLEMEREKDIINKAEADKLQLQLKSSNNRIEELTKLADFRARNYRDNMLKSGISFRPYDEGASEFSDITESELATTENTLDVLVRNCEFDELVLRKMLAGKVLELDGLQTMVAVDFYNHETQNSEISEGLKPNYNFQMAYKVNVDENLITYMENEFLRIEIYGVINSDLRLLGTSYVPFRELLIKNYDVQYGSSAVVLLNSIIYGERKSDIIGVMKLKLRMRHPIGEALRWVKERAEFMKDTQEHLDIRMDPTLKSRKLIVQVDKVSGLDKRAATFVFYKLYNLKDNYTPTVPGQEPQFNHISTHDLAQNESVKHYLEKESLEFVIFDDTQPLLRNEHRVQSAQLGDVLGRGKVKLSSLLENQPIDQHIPIYNIRGQKIASIHVRIYWFDMQNKVGTGDETSNLTKIWEENITRNIVAALRNKGQNLESAFHIFDADGDQKISFEEFRDAITRTFKVKIKEDEIGMYWKRLNLTHGFLYREEFFSRFAPYMSAEENLRATQQRFNSLQGSGSPGMPQIGQIINKNNEDIYNKFGKNNDTFNVLCKKMAQHIQKNNLPVDYFLSKFDRNGNGFISRQEMRNGLYDMGLALSEPEIENLLLYFDINNDNMVSTEEFKVIVRSGVIEELQRLKYGAPNATLASQASFAQRQGAVKQGSFRMETSKQDTRLEVMKFISDYIKQNNYTLLQFTKSLDADGSGTLKRDELTAFFRKIGMKIEQNEMDALFEEIDPKHTNNVPTKKFIEVLQPYIKEKPKMTTGIEQALGLIANYLLDQKMDIYTYFNKFDLNNNGFIERRELKNEIQRMGILISDIELNNLLNFFDDNADGRISSKEFTSHLTPYINTAKKSRSHGSQDTPNSKIIDDLKLKCHRLVRQNSGDLNKGFDLLKESKGLISKENFGKVLLMYNLGFVPAEVDLIIDYFTEKNGEGFVNYEKFLKSYNDPHFDKDVSESQLLSSYGGDKPIKRLSSAEEIFNRMAKVLRENKISSKEAFKIFDKDGSGKISIQELRDAFAGMKLGLTREEIEDVIKHIDKSNDGQIDFKEFIAALKL